MAVEEKQPSPLIDHFKGRSETAFNWIANSRAGMEDQIHASYATYANHRMAHSHEFSGKEEAASLRYQTHYLSWLIKAQQEKTHDSRPADLLMPSGSPSDIAQATLRSEVSILALTTQDVERLSAHLQREDSKSDTAYQSLFLATDRMQESGAKSIKSVNQILGYLEQYDAAHAGDPEAAHSVAVSKYLQEHYTQIKHSILSILGISQTAEKSLTGQLDETVTAGVLHEEQALPSMNAYELAQKLAQDKPDLHAFLTEHGWKPPLRVELPEKRANNEADQLRHEIVALARETDGLSRLGNSMLTLTAEVSEVTSQTWGEENIVQLRPSPEQEKKPAQQAHPHDALLEKGKAAASMQMLASAISRLNGSVEPFGTLAKDPSRTEGIARNVRSQCMSVGLHSHHLMNELQDICSRYDEREDVEYQPFVRDMAEFCEQELYGRIMQNTARLSEKLDRLEALVEQERASTPKGGDNLVTNERFAELRAQRAAAKEGDDNPGDDGGRTGR